MQSGDSVLVCVCFIATSLDQEDLVARKSKAGSKGRAASTRADNDVLIVWQGGGGVAVVGAIGRVPSAVTVIAVSIWTQAGGQRAKPLEQAYMIRALVRELDNERRARAFRTSMVAAV